MARLEDKVAIVTGAARGTGEQTARLFVEEGARVVIADILEEEGRAVAKDLGDAARYERLDVTSEDAWTGVVDGTVEAFGKLDVLVNNAGVLHMGSVEETTPADMERLWRINQLGPFLGMRAVTPALRENGGGSIVNISSNAGLEGVEGVVGYVASKWAVRGMTKTAAIELGKDGIRVNSVHPGGVDTPMLGGDELGHMAASDPFRDQPLPRISQPIEIARLVLFLASDDSSYSTGSEFIADGGRTAGHRDPGIVGD